MTPSDLTKLTALPAAVLALALVGGCDKSGAADDMGDGAAVRTDAGGDMDASMSEFEPYEDYATYYDEATGTTYIAADRAATQAVRDGMAVPPGQSVRASDEAGNAYVLIDTGAVTAGDLMAGYEARNGRTLTPAN